MLSVYACDRTNAGPSFSDWVQYYSLNVIGYEEQKVFHTMGNLQLDLHSMPIEHIYVYAMAPQLA